MTLTYVESNDTLISAGPTFRRAETFPEKIERGTVTTSKNPLLQVLFQTLADEGWSYTFNEDGTCSDTEYWWIEEDSESKIFIYICTDYEWKYQLYATTFLDEAWVSYDIAYYIDGEFFGWQQGSSYNVGYPNT
jgi:hypothetical protein